MVSMDLKAFELIVNTENRARRYLRKFCWKKRHVYCSRCRSYKVYRIRDKKFRCKKCGFTFHDLSGRLLNEVKISNGLEGFWSFAKERLIKFHGVSPEKFPFYLKEMEFRYNH